MKEMPVPQSLLSSQHDTHRNAFKTADNSAIGKKRASRTLSRVFWQQKYFLENLVLARSSLAPENLFRLFANLIRKSIPHRETFFLTRTALSSAH